MIPEPFRSKSNTGRRTGWAIICPRCGKKVYMGQGTIGAMRRLLRLTTDHDDCLANPAEVQS